MPFDDSTEYLNTNRKAWDAYQQAYMDFHLKEHPDFFEYLAKGGTYLPDYEVRLAGDVAGLTVLDVCCASAADEVFSWENLGANAIGCDLSPVAIEIARENARRLKSGARFEVADAQDLAPIAPDSVDLMYGRYLVWFPDVERAMRSWFRVLKPGGRLLLNTCHPIAWCLQSQPDGSYRLRRSYVDETPDLTTFSGTDMAQRHGGWDQRHASVEFHHPVSRILNAILAAGFNLLHIEEPAPAGEASGRELPTSLVVLAHKSPVSPAPPA
jgi:SAM-dependent methyltransferase